jgi:hypothetical protein
VTVSREAQELLDKLAELSRLIEGHEAILWQLKHEQMTLRSRLAATGYKPGQATQGELLP